jgi:hypothetical protein
MEKREPEKCHYCNNKAEYNDLASEGEYFFVTGVCKTHATKYCEGS